LFCPSLTWATGYGESEAGTQAAVTFTHTADCDSARVEFGYDGDGGDDTLNYYAEIRVLPCFSGDGKLLMAEGLELDSIGTHVVKITYFLDDGDAVADGYVAGLWLNKNPSSGDTIQRDASVLVAADNIGIDLDNVSGTLDAGEIGTDAIGATQIADDAIDYGTFAGTAPSAWWNEGKTGYGLSSPQTFDNTGTWTGNLSGSVTGSVGSLDTQAKADVEAECGDALNSYDPPTRDELTTDKDAIITEVDANETKIDNLDDNPWDNLDSDTTSGMGAWFAGWFNADYWLTAVGFSTFDHTSDRVTLVDSSAGDISIAANRVTDLAYFFGACDECYYRLYPEGGLANKDSAIMIDPSLGADSLVGKIIFIHGTVEAVYDTAYFYRAPWW